MSGYTDGAGTHLICWLSDPTLSTWVTISPNALRSGVEARSPRQNLVCCDRMGVNEAVRAAEDADSHAHGSS